MTAPIGPKSENEAVTKYRPFVLKVAKKFASATVSQEDLLQEGLMAVALAWRSWREDGGANFLTWIHRPVYFAMLKVVREQKRQGGSSKGGNRGEGKTPVSLVSLDALVCVVEGNDGSVAYADVLGTFDEPPDPFLRGKLPDLVSSLEQRERQVLRLRFEKGLPYTEVGERLKISRELARQIEQKALEQLKALMSNGEAEEA